jgi:hypothetical protein
LIGPTWVGLGVCVVGFGVYTYEHCHVDVVVDEPFTDASIVTVVLAMTVSAGTDTATVTWFAPDPPQLFSHKTPAASAATAAIFLMRTIICSVS